MANDISAALTAANLYRTIEQRPKVAAGEVSAVSAAKDFQNLVKVEFNKFASMSPEQILTHIKNVQGSSGGSQLGLTDNIAFNAVKSLRKTVEQQDRTVRKSLINEASLIDVLTHTTEATNAIKTMVEVRNKFVEAFDKVMNLSV